LHPLYYDKGSEPTREPRESAPQFVMTTATMTPAVRRLLEPENPDFKKRRPADKDDAILYLPNDIERISAHGLHRVVPRLRQTFVDVGSIDKLSLLTDVVSRGSRGAAPKKNERDALTMVFCNTVASCRAAEHALAESGIESLCYHGDLGSTARVESLKAFRAGDGVRVLVCTDIAARGLDIPEVDHVVMFDFPLNSIDYLHRAGRTARGLSDVGAKGRVTALVAKRDKVLATAIERAVQMGMPLDELTSRKSDYRNDGKLGKKIREDTRGASPARGARVSMRSGTKTRTAPKPVSKETKKPAARRTTIRRGGGIR
jgi:superfamily II DNA/RNA helicase